MIDLPDINDFDYALPDDLIAQFPLAERDLSRLLVSRNGTITETLFREIADYLPGNTVLIFNNSRVIRARLLFRKDSGSTIEIFLLEPFNPAGYESSLGSANPVEWICMVGNLKRWKGSRLITIAGPAAQTIYLAAENMGAHGDFHRIRFSWDNPGISFAEVIGMAGRTPLPPYIKREDSAGDAERYQTVYSDVSGSVAAPTAGLHFTEKILEGISARGIKTAPVTLHVGAGTFQPVKGGSVYEHTMHSEFFTVSRDTIELITGNQGNIVAVGTTTVRTIESLYWLGRRIYLGEHPDPAELEVEQWEPYSHGGYVDPPNAYRSLLRWMNKERVDSVNASTRIFILPGYRFMITSGLVTNFHMPRSTLLLLVSAFTEGRWREIYDYALSRKFRFLSYGDSSLLLR